MNASLAWCKPTWSLTVNSATRSVCAAKSRFTLQRYYNIEWLRNGRKREQIRDRAEVMGSARSKAVELEANCQILVVGCRSEFHLNFRGV
jgi:hypothetical protein